MAQISKLTVTQATPVQIVATQTGVAVQIQEDLAIGTAWPTTDFLIFRPPLLPTSGLSRRIAKGNTYSFSKGGAVPQSWSPGDTIGWVQTVTGTTTFIVDESGS